MAAICGATLVRRTEACWNSFGTHKQLAPNIYMFATTIQASAVPRGKTSGWTRTHRQLSRRADWAKAILEYLDVYPVDNQHLVPVLLTGNPEFFFKLMANQTETEVDAQHLRINLPVVVPP